MDCYHPRNLLKWRGFFRPIRGPFSAVLTPIFATNGFFCSTFKLHKTSGTSFQILGSFNTLVPFFFKTPCEFVQFLHISRGAVCCIEKGNTIYDMKHILQTFLECCYYFLKIISHFSQKFRDFDKNKITNAYSR